MLASRMVERGTLDVVGLDAADEARDVDAGGAGLEAGRVEAEIAAAGLDQGQLAVERRVQLVEVPGVVLWREAPGPDVDLLAHPRASFVREPEFAGFPWRARLATS